MVRTANVVCATPVCFWCFLLLYRASGTSAFCRFTVYSNRLSSVSTVRVTAQASQNKHGCGTGGGTCPATRQHGVTATAAQADKKKRPMIE